MESEIHRTAPLLRPPQSLDYSLTGENARMAIEKGLAEADWYQTPLPRTELRALLERKDGPAIRDTLLLVGILTCTGYLTALMWGTWWAVLPYFIYVTFYGTASDSRWHECGHGTAFKTDWMNNAIYEVASFMAMRESTVWRWSHTRHHSDTIIVGRDPEIQVPRPPDIRGLFLSVFNFSGYRTFFTQLLRHALGHMSAAEKTYIPPAEFTKVYHRARIYLGLYVTFIAWAVVAESFLPIFLFVLPQFFGTWLMIVHNTTQHAGLAENVLDHRLNCRTVYMNPISRFIYWNMNYHLEHHMFPLVPYHALPKLHQLIRDDCPPPYPSIISAWREIWPTILRQRSEPAYHIKRQLPAAIKRPAAENPGASPTPVVQAGWIEVGASADLRSEDVIRFDFQHRTFALVRDASGRLFATDGICTHGNTHLANGLVKGAILECPKHNGRFHFADGSPARAPVCRGLATYAIEERHGRIWLKVERAIRPDIPPEKTHRFRVVSNCNVATFIKELVLEPIDADQLSFRPGDYLQVDVPAYEQIKFSDFDVPEPYAEVWRRHALFALSSSNPTVGLRNNYSLASNATTDRNLKFNVRIATPPPGQDCPPGKGSSYIFNLRPGDTVTAVGPHGDFHIKPTQREMVYLGGGAGMAPIRAHLSHLLETEKTSRKISFWYGARSRQELFYHDYFLRLAREHPNFSFHVALSAPSEHDQWTGKIGFIHEVAFRDYLERHPKPHAVEFYLCGPPQMIKATTKMLELLRVPASQVACDSF